MPTNMSSLASTGCTTEPRRPVRVMDRAIRVCHLGKYYPPAPGGFETHLQTLARSQAALGATVQVVCVNHAAAGGEDVTWKAFHPTRTIEENDGPVRVIRVGRIASLARLDLCPRLLSVLRPLFGEGTDIIHLHTPNPTMLLALAALRCRAAVVVTHHSDVVRQRFLRRLQAPFERRVYDRAAAILTDSPTYAAGSPVLQRYADKVHSLPLGIDLVPFAEPTAAALAHAGRLRVEHGEPLWLMVGRLIYYKGIGTALAALAHVPGKLLVIGTGPLGPELKRQAEQLGVASRVIWHGHADSEQLIGAYHAATALWFPSNARSEGFGLVQVEAMASGCPVINTAIPDSGVAWVSRHEETGLTVPMNDAEALAGPRSDCSKSRGCGTSWPRGAGSGPRRNSTRRSWAEKASTSTGRSCRQPEICFPGDRLGPNKCFAA